MKYFALLITTMFVFVGCSGMVVKTNYSKKIDLSKKNGFTIDKNNKANQINIQLK